MSRIPRSMRHIVEILRLKHQHQLSVREIARSCGLPPSTVGDYVQRAEAAGLRWPLPEGLSEDQLHALLLRPAAPGDPGLPRADAAGLDAHPRRTAPPQRHPAIALAGVPPGPAHGYSYTRFCELYRAWAKTLEPVLRQVHVPGERCSWTGPDRPCRFARPTARSPTLAVRRRAGRQQQDLRRGLPQPATGSWITGHCHAYAFFRRRAAADRA